MEVGEEEEAGGGPEVAAGDDRVCALLSHDGARFEVPLRVARLSVLVREMTEDLGADGLVELPLPNVGAAQLDKVLEFCAHHIHEPMPALRVPLPTAKLGDLLPQWYEEYIDLEEQEVQGLLLAANYLDIPPLLELAAAKIAAGIKAMGPEEFDRRFDTDAHPLTAEQRQLVESENYWGGDEGDAVPLLVQQGDQQGAAIGQQAAVEQHATAAE